MSYDYNSFNSNDFEDNIHDFSNSMKIGEKGELIIKDWLRTSTKVLDIQDVTNIKQYQDTDIDLIIKFKNHNTTSVEIKTDTFQTGNLFFEAISNEEYGTPGCMYKSKADWLFYYFISTNELYVIRLNKYTKWFTKNKDRFKSKRIANKSKSGNGVYHSIGYLIPKAMLEVECSDWCKKYYLK